MLLRSGCYYASNDPSPLALELDGAKGGGCGLMEDEMRRCVDASS